MTLAKLEGDGWRVLDVGSLDVNGTFRPIVEARGWHYDGLDMQPGPNVDIVANGPADYPLPSESYDLVISGSTMEHVGPIWAWMPEVVRVLKPGGWLVIITHWRYPLHRYPKDYWRIMPDGMELLLENEPVDIMRIEMFNENDIIGIARKREN